MMPSDAVAEYFAGERKEMLLILAGSAGLAMLAMGLWVATRSAFAMAFALTILAAAVLLSTTAGTLLVRDGDLFAFVKRGIESSTRMLVVQAERERIGIVLSKYRYYRYGAALITAACVMGLMISDRGWVHGVAAGLLLVVVAQVIIDRFSERRADVYFDHLTKQRVNLLPPTSATLGHQQQQLPRVSRGLHTLARQRQ